ncbi:hypothetical protein AB0G06_43490 [Nonomuraea dietziae]|uniref:hypothetical protein n=1 Tax=Nonomuraea dietziae TaxID=65515 RepID=UPI0033D2E500
MTEITAEAVAKHLADWADYEWINIDAKVRVHSEGEVVKIGTWTGEPNFHAIVLPGKYGAAINDEPQGYKAIVVDDMGDAWQRHGADRWHCAIDGDDYSYWSWRKLVDELGPITLICAGDPGDWER